MKRIFVSSTFRDMQYERDLFHTVITPKLNGYAREYGESVSFCDLRWGVNTSELESEEGARKVLSVCLNEIDRCKPYMVVILGDRYGWIPDKKLIKDAADKKHFDIDDMERSVTALEIEYGALRDSEHISRTLFYFREFEEDIPKDSKYAVDGNTDSERNYYKKRLNELKDKIKAETGNSVKTYRVRLDEDGESILGLEPFVEMVTNDIRQLMENEWHEYAMLSPHEKVVCSQWNIAEQKSAQFGARENIVDSIIDFFHKYNRIIAIKGKTGSGKSTLLSRLAYKLKDDGMGVIPIFCGSRTELNDGVDVLRYIVYELESMMGISHIEDTSAGSSYDYESSSKTIGVDKLRERLTSLISDYNGQKIAILIDAVDQLFADEWREKLIFLPLQPNDKIKVAFSCLDDFTSNQSSADDYNIIQLTDLTKDEIELSIRSILKYFGRELENSVIEELISKPQSTNPLYLSLLIQRLVMMDKHDFDDIYTHGDSDDARAAHKINVIHSISSTVEGACFDILNEASTRIGSDFTHTALEYIALSTNGLRESDLEEILEKQGLKWSSLEFSILTNYLQGFFLTRDDGRIDFTHRTIREGITCRCDNAEVKHQNIRNHLHTLGWSDPVGLDETVYQCFKADDKDYFVWYIEDIIKDDFYTGINSASKSLYDVINKNGIEWIESILNENYDRDLTKHFYKFVYIHLRPHFLHSTKKYEEIIKIMQSAAIRCSASADINSEEDVLLMADINFYLGDCFSDLSKYSLANQYFTDAIRLYEKIRDGDNPSAEKMLATVYNTYGLMMDAENKHEKALHYFDLALQIRERRGEYNQALCASYHNVAYHYYNVGDYQQALSYSRKSVEVIEKYALENEKDSAELMVTVYRRISLIYKALNRKEQGIAYIDKALRVAQKYIAFQPEVFEIKLGYIYNDKALILECAEQKNETIECYSNSIRIFEKYAEKFPEKYEETMATVICNLAGEYEKSADTYSLSEKMYVRGINIKEKILSSGLNSIAMSLATSYNNLGCLYLKQNKHGEARHYYLLAISTAMKSSREELYFKRNTLSTFYRNASLIYIKLMMPIKAARYADYSRDIDECKTFAEFDNYCSKKLLVSNRSFLLKKDDSIHPFIKANLLANLALIFYFFYSLHLGELNSTVLVVTLIMTYVLGLLASIVAIKEVNFKGKQKAILWISWYLSAGLVTVWYVLYNVIVSRIGRKCGNDLRSIKLLKVDKSTGLIKDQLQRKIDKLTRENETLEKRLKIVKDKKFSRKRTMLLLASMLLGALAIFLFIVLKDDVVNYISFLKDTSNKNILSVYSNKDMGSYVYNELAKRAGRGSFIVAVLLFLPMLLSNVTLAYLNIKNVWQLSTVKRIILFIISVLSLGTLSGVASCLLFYRDTYIKDTSFLGLISMCIYLPFAWPLFLLISVKSYLHRGERFFDNSLDLKIHRNTERINQYKLELMRVNCNQR